MAELRPLYRFQTFERMSGGGKAVESNIELASRLYPRVLGRDPDSPFQLVPRNWVDPHLLRSGAYVLMPQNAWPWSGSVTGLRGRSRRASLRVASEVSIARARGVIRIGESIPQRRRTVGNVLSNVLDEGFEVALRASTLATSCVTDRGSFVCIGSLTSYRGIDVLLDGYDQYRHNGGSMRLVVAGPGRPSRKGADGLPDGVLIIPRALDRSSAIASFRDASAVIFPSTVEASPLGLLEAASVCATVLVTDIPGHRQSSQNLHFFAANDPASLAKAMATAEARIGNGIDLDPLDPQQIQVRRADREKWCASLSRRLIDVADGLSQR